MDCFTFWDTKQDFHPVTIPVKSPVVQSAILRNSTLLLTNDQIFQFPLKALVPKSINFQFPVSQIASSQSFALLLTEAGLWALGVDDSKSGLFAEEHLFSSEVPLKISFFDGLPLGKVSVWTSHAAVISQDGQLYTWGSGNYGELGNLRVKSSKPAKVDQASFFKSSEVCCGEKFTAVSTEAGFLFLFCKRKNCSKCKKTNSYPCTINSIQNDFVRNIFAYGEELIILNDSGEVKLLDKCFCVNALESRGRVAEVACFDEGFVGLAADKKFLYVWRKANRGWSCDNLHLDYGDVSNIVSGTGKQIGIVGKRIQQKSFKKVKDSFVLDCSHRSVGEYERVTFEEIVNTLGFKGKIYSMDQGKIFESIEKVYVREVKNVFQEIWKFSYSNNIRNKSRNLASAGFLFDKSLERIHLRLLASVFEQLQECPKKKLNTIVALSSRFVSVSVEKYWNLWAALTKGYNQCRLKYLSMLKSQALKHLVLILSSHKNSRLLSSFYSLKPFNVVSPPNASSQSSQSLTKTSSKVLPFVLLHSIKHFEHIQKRKALKVLSSPQKSHKRHLHTLTQSSPAGIEISATTSATSKTLSISIQSISSDTEKLSFSKSMNAKKAQERIQTKFANSCKLSEGSNMLIDTLTPKSELSPEVKSPSTPSLRSQMSQKMGEKPSKFPNIKLNQERSSSKNSAQVPSKPPVRDAKKNSSFKEPLSPKVLMKKNTEDFAKKGVTLKSQENLNLQLVQKSSKMSQFLKKSATRVLKESLSLILKPPALLSQATKPNPVKSPQALSTSQNNHPHSWKSKMHALAFNKLFKVLSPLISNQKDHSFKCLKFIITG